MMADGGGDGGPGGAASTKGDGPTGFTDPGGPAVTTQAETIGATQTPTIPIFGTALDPGGAPFDAPTPGGTPGGVYDTLTGSTPGSPADVPLPQPRPAAITGIPAAAPGPAPTAPATGFTADLIDPTAANAGVGGDTGTFGGTQGGGPGAQQPAPAAKDGTQSLLAALGIGAEQTGAGLLNKAIATGGLGYALTQGQKTPAFTPELQAQAARLDANGQKLMNYLQNGDLPPGLKASLDQATAAAKSKVISNFAAQGLNTDPTKNSVLAQQLAQIDQQAIISTAQIGQQLMQTGVAQTGLSSELYKTLANIDATQTAQIGQAISRFAAAMTGGPGA